MTSEGQEGERLLVDAEGEPTPLYRRYLRYQQEYRKALRARDQARTRARRNPVALQNWPIVGRSYQEAIDSALDRWLTLGQKDRVERVLGMMRSRRDRDEAEGGGGSKWPCQ
jgi:hypothetical protein